MPSLEHHRSQRAGWLRAAVLGANDGIVSVAALMVGVASASAEPTEVLVAGIAGVSAGALSMAAGEYVSVSSQRDAELADVRLERQAHEQAPAAELQELVDVYIGRGLDPGLARQVAEQFTARAPLQTHLREELGLDPTELARPLQAAGVSAVAFVAGASVPLLVSVVLPGQSSWVVLASSLCLAGTGALGAFLGGAPLPRAILRVVAGGLLAMAATWGIGTLVGLSL